MAGITAALVKELRDKTGAGMMDCKKALSETDGDIEAAVDWLRTKGLSKAAKKADRVASDGLVGVAVAANGSGMTGAAVEVNSETDFVARNELFMNTVREVAELAIPAGGDVEAIKAAKMASGETVSEALTNLVAKIGENMTMRRAITVEANPGVVATYVHNAAGENLGKIGVLVGLKSDGDQDKLAEVGRKLAMHVAAGSPAVALSIDVSDLDQAEVEKERTVLADQARESGKPEEIIGKMVEGRISKFYKEVVLLEQTFVVDGENTVKAAIDLVAKEIGSPIEVVGMVRFAVGEGIEKEESDFAAEVAAAAR